MATTRRLDPPLAVVLLAALVPARAVWSAPGPEHAGRQFIGGPVVSNAGPPPAPAGRGWRHLSQGRFSQALYSFARQAAASPGAEPKVGYVRALGGLAGRRLPGGGVHAPRLAGRPRIAAGDQH